MRLPKPEEALLPVRPRGPGTPEGPDHGRGVAEVRPRRVVPAAVQTLLRGEPREGPAQVGGRRPGRRWSDDQARVAPRDAVGEGEEVGAERTADALDRVEVVGAGLGARGGEEDEACRNSFCEWRSPG